MVDQDFIDSPIPLVLVPDHAYLPFYGCQLFLKHCRVQDQSVNPQKD